MTDQYLPTNVNAPRGSRLITEDALLTLDDDLVVVENTSVDPITVTLPDATQIPAREIKFKADTLTNPVVIDTIAGQTIDGEATTSLTTDQESVCLKSDGANWRKVCGGGDACCAPELLQDPSNFLSEAIFFPGASSTFDFQATKVEVDGGGNPLATVVLLEDTGNPGADVAVTNFTVTGTADVAQEVSIEITDQSGGGDSGAVWVLLQNPCGCCVLVGHLNVAFL